MIYIKFYRFIKKIKKILFIFTVFAILTYFLSFSFTHADYYEFIWDTAGPENLLPSVELKYIAGDLTSSNLLAAVSGGRVYRSIDGGDAWGEVQPAGDQNKNWISVSVSGNGNVMLAAVSGGRVYRSIDGGDGWGEVQPAGDQNKNWISVSVSGDGNAMLAAVSGGRLYRSIDSGDAWDEVEPAGNENKNWISVSVSGDGNAMLAAVSGGRLYRSIDSGDAWDEVEPAGSENKNWISVSINSDGSVMLAAVSGGRVYIEDSTEDAWRELNIIGELDNQWSSVVVSEDGSTLFILASPGRLYYSTNLGSSWYETQPAGNSNQTWSNIIVNQTGSIVWVANQTNELFSGERDLVTPSAPENITITNNVSSLKTLNGFPVFKTEEIQNSGPSVFDYAHGNVQINDKFYIGTRTTPSKIIVFNNPNDLSDYNSVTIPNTSSIGTMTFDSENYRIYAAVQMTNTNNFTILSIDPDNINSYSTVVSENLFSGSSDPGLVTDNTYVYGVTYANPIKIFKYRIADWELVNSADWVGDASLGHAGQIYTYSDRTELYFTAAAGTQTVIKVDASDLSYEIFELDSDIVISDDIAFRPLDDTGGLLYISSEISNIAYVLDTRDMSIDSFFAPTAYGVFINGNNLYLLGNSGYIAKYPNFDIDSVRLFDLTNEVPNEFFMSSSGKKFFTNWKDIPLGIITSYLKEYEETTILSTPNTVTITWEEETPDVTFQIFLSTDGVNYTTLESNYANFSYTLNNLLSDNEYWFKIIAKNDTEFSSPVIFTFTTASFDAASLSSVPTVSYLSSGRNSISLQWEGDANEYFVKIGDTKSGWISGMDYTFYNLTCNTEYQISLKGRNDNNVETDYRTMSISTSACSSNGLISNQDRENNSLKSFDFLINNGDQETDNQELIITHLNQQENISNISIWLNEDSGNKLVYPFTSKINFKLPAREGLYTVHIGYYVSGSLVQVVSKSIVYRFKDIPKRENFCRDDSFQAKYSDVNVSIFNRLKGKFLLATEDKGKIWYISPKTGYRYEVKESVALCLFQSSALGISDSNLEKISKYSQSYSSLGDRFKGWILLQVEDRGKTWYVSPSKNRIQVTSKTLLDIAKQHLTGVLNKDLTSIPTYYQ